MMSDWSYSFRWIQPYPNWRPIQLRVAHNDEHRRAVQAELDQLDALEKQVQTADLEPIANLLKSLGKNS
jgi:hypothetical protein